MDLQVTFFVGWKTIELNSSINRNQGVILLCGKSDSMPPDEFRTELSDSLTTFYDNILKKSCAGGRPAAKHLSRKFVTQTASVPDPPGTSGPMAVRSDDTNANAVEPPADAAAAAPAPPPAPAAEAAAPPANKGNQTGGRASSG
jgi:hypothetical protein